MSKRVSLILRDADDAVIAPFLTEDSSESEALRLWATDRGLGDVTSEASGLRALLRAGAEAIQERAVVAGYALLADEFNSPENNAVRRAARDRYVARREPEL